MRNKVKSIKPLSHCGKGKVFEINQRIFLVKLRKKEKEKFDT
jgi:hypothetical protein